MEISETERIEDCFTDGQNESNWPTEVFHFPIGCEQAVMTGGWTNRENNELMRQRVIYGWRLSEGISEKHATRVGKTKLDSPCDVASEVNGSWICTNGD